MPHRNLGGRPPKFQEPSKPITVTLPESTLRLLGSIHEDRGMAIVRLAKMATQNRSKESLVEVVKINKKSGLIMIGYSRVLERIAFLHQVEVGTGRYLLAVDPEHDFRSLELALHDLLDEPDSLSPDEHQLVSDLLTQVSRLRKSGRVSRAEILLVDLSASAPRSGSTSAT